MGFSACGSGHPGAVLQPAGPLGRQAPRWKSLSHLQVGTRCRRSGRCSGHWALRRERWPCALPPQPCPAGQGRGSWGKRKVPDETASLAFPGPAHLPGDLGSEGDTCQLAGPPASGELEVAVHPGPPRLVRFWGGGERQPPGDSGGLSVCVCVYTCVSPHRLSRVMLGWFGWLLAKQSRLRCWRWAGPWGLRDARHLDAGGTWGAWAVTLYLHI